MKQIELEIGKNRNTFDIPDGVKKVTVKQVGDKIVLEMVPEKEPKPGDVMVNDGGSVYIFKEVYDDYTHNHYAWLGTNGRLTFDAMCNPGSPATPEEAQLLWDALKKAGKRWNPEAMQVEDIPERERIMDFLQGYVTNVKMSRQKLCWLIEAYINHREGKK
jgi:hypothetical protein